MQKLLSVKEAAEMLNVHPNTIRKLINRNELEAVRIGQKVLRISESALLEKTRQNDTE